MALGADDDIGAGVAHDVHESRNHVRRKIQIAVEEKDKVAALKIMLQHYKESGFPVTSCKGLAAVEVFRVVLTEVTGKRNL